MTLTEFLVEIRPEVEHSIDEQILAEPPEGRVVLMRHRELLISKALDRILIENLKRRNRELEERLRPRLVETDQ